MIMDKVLSSRILRAAPGGGAEIAIRLPWYRALPLSVIEIVRVRIDGEPIARERVQIIVDGRGFAIDDMKNQTEVVWYMRDDAFLRVDGFELVSGQAYRVEVSISWNPPYAKGWWPVTDCADTLQAA
uniref:C-deglycosylation enzyme beta subunit n=1 Tax=Caulobacter sp. (strain K31) TaxID=366602 RepID=B0T5K0_CAUSK